MKNLIVLMILALVAVGCAKKSTPSNSSKRVTLTPEMMNAVTSQQTFTCPAGNCPYALARLFIVNFKNPKQSGNCTGTLVGERLLLTNSHCLDVAPTKAEVCRGFYAIFKTQTGAMETARCSKILFRDNHVPRNDEDLSDRDYALVKLDRTVNVKPLKIEPIGFAPGDFVNPYVIDHTSTFSARIVKLSCKVTSTSSNGRDLKLDKCPAIPGNSGSPILNGRDRVAGILYAGQDLEEINEETPYSTRTSHPAFSLGFPMNMVLDDLAEWLAI